MDFKAKVINIITYKKNKEQSTNKNNRDIKTKVVDGVIGGVIDEIGDKKFDEAKIFDISKKRKDAINSERRSVRRTILSEFIGTYMIVPSKGLQKVVIHDLSDKGLAFDLDLECGKLQEDQEIAMRVYLNKNTYFPFIVKITNVREVTEEEVFRHGANFVKGTINDIALHHFIKFIENVSASLKKDEGDVMVSNLSNFPPSAS